MAEHTMSQF